MSTISVRSVMNMHRVIVFLCSQHCGANVTKSLIMDAMSFVLLSAADKTVL